MVLQRSFSRPRPHYPILLLFFLLSISSCNRSFTRMEYKKGEEAAEKQNFEKAIVHFENAMRRDPESAEALDSARATSRIAMFDLKKYLTAIKSHQHLVKFSQQESERRDAQKKIAEIYFEKLADYPKAIEEYNKLLLLQNSTQEIVNFRFALARAHFYLNQFAEAQSEIESSLKLIETDDPQKFDQLMFLGNVFFNTKKVDLAIEVYNRVIKDFPKRAADENVEMNVIVCYEELEQFDRAIELLEKLRSSYRDPEFIDLKIKRLKERKANLPGSRGLRK